MLRLVKGALVLAAVACMAWAMAWVGQEKLAVRTQFARQGALLPKNDAPGGVVQSLAVEGTPEGEILVLSLDGGRMRLQRFDQRMALLGQASEGALKKAAEGAVDMAVAADGSVHILRRGGWVGRLDRSLRPSGEWKLGQEALALEADLEGGLYALLEDGSGVAVTDAKGASRGFLPLEPVRGLQARRLAVTPKGWVAALMLGKGDSTIQVLQPGGASFLYKVPNLKNDLYDHIAAMPQERVLLNRSGDLGLLTVDLNTRLVERRCFDSDKNDLFKNPGFVSADKRTGLLFVGYAEGLVAGRMP